MNDAPEPAPASYSPPVDQLLTLGFDDSTGWPDYSLLGINATHIPELMRMATDKDLLFADIESDENLATVHAMHALGQLQVVEAIYPLLDLIDEYEEEYWFGPDISIAIGTYGASALPVLRDYLADKSKSRWSKSYAAQSLIQVVEHHPELRLQSIEVLTDQLACFEKNEPDLNGAFVNYLLDLEAIESLEIIQQAYERECVSLDAVGDFEDVEIFLGLKEWRISPSKLRPRADFFTAEDTYDTEPMLREGPKIGRNDPCPCGSGKKYKKCCGW